VRADLSLLFVDSIHRAIDVDAVDFVDGNPV